MDAVKSIRIGEAAQKWDAKTQKFVEGKSEHEAAAAQKPKISWRELPKDSENSQPDCVTKSWKDGLEAQ